MLHMLVQIIDPVRAEFIVRDHWSNGISFGYLFGKSSGG